MTQQLALDGRDTRVQTYLNRSCLCDPCWCARCTACGEPVTKHNYTEDDAYRDALHGLLTPGHFQHRCKVAA